MKENPQWNKDLAETASLVSYLRLLLRPENQYLVTPAIKELAYQKLTEAGIMDEEGNYEVSQDLWMLVNADRNATKI